MILKYDNHLECSIYFAILLIVIDDDYYLILIVSLIYVEILVVADIINNPK